uniref:Uncharacterized protein n=1 Tax=Oryza nivara TaxID=4536 RepID=A0A0E0FS90_ORYNI
MALRACESQNHSIPKSWSEDEPTATVSAHRETQATRDVEDGGEVGGTGTSRLPNPGGPNLHTVGSSSLRQKERYPTNARCAKEDGGSRRGAMEEGGSCCCRIR